MFLGLTANQAFWNEGNCDVFLGRWCIPKDKSLETERVILPYVFDDRGKLYQSYLYADAVYARMMPCLTKGLNAIHQVECSQRYWEIVIGYWLREYIEILLERYECIRSALTSVSDAQVKLIHENDYFTPEDGLDFEKHCTKDLYNQQLYSQIIEYLGGVDMTYVSVSPDAWELPCGGWRSRLKLRLKDLVKWTSLLCSRWNRIYICSMYFPVAIYLKLARRLRIFPTVDTPRFVINSPKAIKPKLRERFAAPSSADTFENLMWLTLQWNMPRIYIENFSTLKQLVNKHYPKRAKLVVTANAFAVNEGFKLWAAGQTESYGTPYVIHQHGGNYGCALWNSTEDYEAQISDYYLTYGWTDPGRKNITPFCASRIVGPKDGKICGDRHGDILWVLASLPRYAYAMYSLPVGPQFKGYLDEQVQFLSSLGPEARDLITCRPFYIDYGWSDMDYIRHGAGDFAIDRGNKSLQSRLNSTRLCVCTYNGTTYIETFAANVPTILFWPRKHWEIRESAKKAFDGLYDVGILHHSPEKAAEKVDSIQKNTFDWWRQSDIQQARAYFCEQFGNVCDTPDRIWANWLLEHASPN